VQDDLQMDLFESGLMDSLAFAEFLVALEEEYDVVIAPSEVEREEINTPEKILELVKSRL
jgi:D-alanine--poly(phosphoribitol) ligase subunit 2